MTTDLLIETRARMTQRQIIWIFVLLVLLGLGAYLGLSARFAFVNHPYDKIAHFFGFGFGTVMLGLYFRNFTLALPVMIFAGALLEGLQYFSQVRRFSFIDIGANVSGAIAAWIVAILVVALINWHKKRSA